MNRSALARIALSLPAVLLLSLAVSGQAIAASLWSSPVIIASGSGSGLVALDNSTLVAAYEKCVGGDWCDYKVVLKRSTDGGATWGGRLLLAGDDADMSAIAGRGKSVDAVWRDTLGRLRYARSTDSGASFGRSRILAYDGSTREPSVARGSAGLVAVAWGEWPDGTDQISVRVSTDGGRTFGAKTSWPTVETDVSAVAIGGGVIYVMHLARNGPLVVHRSSDAGRTWSRTTITSRSGIYWPQLTADGREAYVAYEVYDEVTGTGIRYRGSHDNGTTWFASRPLAPQEWNVQTPSLALQDGVLRAVFSRQMTSSSCPDGRLDRLFYTQSRDGLNWTAPEPVSPKRVCYARWSHGVGIAGKVVVLYDDEVNVYTQNRLP